MSELAARRGRAWAMWPLPALLFFIAFFHRAAPGIIAKDLMQEFGVTSARVGLLAATYFDAYAALMIPSGLLIDAFGSWGCSCVRRTARTCMLAREDGSARRAVRGLVR